MSEYKSSYGTARIVLQSICLLGWAVTSLSVVVIILSIIGGYSEDVLMPMLMTSLTGLMIIMLGQMSKAVLDNSDNTGRMLAIMEEDRTFILTEEIKD